MDRHHHLARLALDLDVRDRRMSEPRLEILPQQLVFLEQRREFPIRVPARAVELRDSEAKANRMCLLTH
jgi:hypothetical protein